MTSRFHWVVAVMAIFVVCAGISPARGDAYIKQIRHTAAHQVMGQQVPAETDTTELWFSDKTARMDTGDGKFVILQAEKNTIYLIDSTDKTYVEIPLDGQGMLEALMPSGEGEDAEAAAMMKQMAANMLANTTVTVTPTEERKKIRDWNARKYMVAIKMPMGTANSEVWASPEIKIDARLFEKMSMAMSGMMADMEKMAKEMEKIDGMEVYNSTVVDMMGTKIQSTQEVIEYSQKPAPAGAYTLPSGYTKTKMGMGE
jgi:hypothetical protein